MDKNSNKKFTAKSIYRISIVLAAVCVCTAVVSLNTMRAKNSAAKYNVAISPPTAQNEKVTEPAPVSKPKTDVPKTQTQSEPKQAAPIQAKPATGEEKPAFSIESVELLRPAAGKIVFAHSGDELVYHKLYDDWRVHSGVDITATASSQVKAAYDGTVEDVKPDGFGKYVITLNHKYFKTVYSGVSTEKIAEKGKTVKKGDVISGVPDKSSLYDLPHISFELIYRGKSIDPEPLFK